MSFLKSTLSFSSGTMLSRVLGLVRESVVAGVFGASALLDAFLVANRIPNMLREIAAEGALGSAFTKVFTQRWQKDPQEAKVLLLQSLVFFGLVIFLLSALAIWAAPLFVKALTLFQHESRGEEFYKNTVLLTRILFPFIILMTVTAILSGALYQRGKFFLSAVSPICLSLGYISGSLLIGPFLQKNFPDMFFEPMICGLAFGVLLGGLGQMLVCFYGVRKYFFPDGFFYTNFSWKISSDLKKILVLTGPMIIAASSMQINVLVNTNFATSLQVGAVSWLSYSFRLLQLPVGVFAVALSSVILPSLSIVASSKEPAREDLLKQKLRKSIEACAWVLTPCGCLLFWGARDIVGILYQHGNFSGQAATATAQALSCYALGLLGYGLIKVLTTFYYALDDTKFAMKVSLGAIVVNFILNSLLVSSFGFVGLALSTALLVTFNAGVLYLGLRRKNIFVSSQSLLRLGFYVGLGVITAYLGSFVMQNYLAKMLQVSSFSKINYTLSFGCYLLWVVGVFLFLLSKFYNKSFYDLRSYFKGTK